MKKRIVDLENYMHTAADRWRWGIASGADTQAIVDLALQNFGSETVEIFRNDPIVYSRNVTLAIVTQFYNPRAELFSVAKDAVTGQLLAYTWAVRNERAPWSDEEMVAIRVAHCAMDLSSRERLFLCAQMIRMWEKWADACEIKIICSSTIREDQPGFLRLHTDAGFDVRGSIAYKRLSHSTFDIGDASTAMVNTTINAKNTSYNADEYNSHSTDHSTSSQDRRF